MPSSRLLLVAHAAAPDAAVPRFPGCDDLAEAPAAAALGRRVQEVTCGPEPACATTLSAITDVPAARVDPRWAGPDVGSWAGAPMEQVQADDPGGMQAWLSDPTFDGHGGESLTALADRIGDALAQDRPAGLSLVVASAFTVRTAALVALGLSPGEGLRVAVGPLDGVELSRSARGWSLTALRPDPQWRRPPAR